jgi:hypothetical protein
MRIEGWQRQLNLYLLESQRKYSEEGFKWGEFDCFHFVADWVLLITGIDHLAEYRGTYSTEEQAFSILKEKEGSVYDALQKRFGDPVHPGKAMRGDIAYRKDENSLGIYLTSGARMAALFLGKRGFTIPKAKDTDHAFRVL